MLDFASEKLIDKKLEQRKFSFDIVKVFCSIAWKISGPTFCLTYRANLAGTRQ
jgi:hypothetical protein